MIDEITHADVLLRRDINEFLGYVDGLKADSEDEDYSEEERASFKELLDEHDPELVEQLRAMVDYGDDDFISEGHWDTYAAELADKVYLYDIPQIVKDYFDYETWASDLTADYTPFEYDGVTYYTRA